MNKVNRISELFSLSGKVALVTGGAINIGRAISLRLAEAGAGLAVTYHSSYKEAIDLGRSLTELGVEHVLMQTDLRDESKVVALVKQTIEHFGRIDILVNNAGVFGISAQQEMESKEWDEVFNVNVKGMFLVTKEVLKAMQSQIHGGVIVNIASINAMHPGFTMYPGFATHPGIGKSAHYDASKGAVVAYTNSVATEVAGQGIRVNAVAPGLVDSEDLRKSESELVEAVEKRTPLQKLASAEDVANAVLFLSSKAASHMTGATIVVDGGYLLT